jgi:hypothetical protein
VIYLPPTCRETNQQPSISDLSTEFGVLLRLLLGILHDGIADDLEEFGIALDAGHEKAQQNEPPSMKFTLAAIVFLSRSVRYGKSELILTSVPAGHSPLLQRWPQTPSKQTLSRDALGALLLVATAKDDEVETYACLSAQAHRQTQGYSLVLRRMTGSLIRTWRGDRRRREGFGISERGEGIWGEGESALFILSE